MKPVEKSIIIVELILITVMSHVTGHKFPPCIYTHSFLWRCIFPVSAAAYIDALRRTYTLINSDFGNKLTSWALLSQSPLRLPAAATSDALLPSAVLFLVSCHLPPLAEQGKEVSPPLIATVVVVVRTAPPPCSWVNLNPCQIQGTFTVFGNGGSRSLQEATWKNALGEKMPNFLCHSIQA